MKHDLATVFNLTAVYNLASGKFGRGDIIMFNIFSESHHRHDWSVSITRFLANVILTFTFAICYRPSVCRLSVCRQLSVTLVHPTQAIELFGNFFSPYDSPGTLLFWCQKSLVGDAPFPLKFAFKVTYPLSNSTISTNIGS